MAFSATELLEARLFFEDAAAGKFQQNELRRPVINTVNAFVESTPYSVIGGEATIKNLKKSGEQSVKIPVQTKFSSDNGTARSCASSGTEGDSALTTVSFSTYTEKFSTSELLFANNDIPFQAAFRHALTEKMKILMQRLEQNLVNYLDANLASAHNATSGGMATYTAGVGRISLADKNEYFSRIYTAMMQNNFTPMYQHVHSMGLTNRINLQQFEGAGNSNNLAPQQEGFKHYAANLIPTTGSNEGHSFVFVPGTVGVLNWNNPLHKQNRTSGQDTWTTIANPFIPSMTFDLKIKEDCVDNSGTSSSRGADLVTYFELVLEFARYKAYTSGSDTGIYKFELANA